MFNKDLKKRIEKIESILKEYPDIEKTCLNLCDKEYKRIFKKIKKQIHKFKKVNGVIVSIISNGADLAIKSVCYSSNYRDFYIYENGEQVIIKKKQAEYIYYFVSNFVEETE